MNKGYGQVASQFLTFLAKEKQRTTKLSDYYTN